MSTKEQVTKILKEIKPTRDFEGVANIIDGGYLDSLELMGLITALTENFEVDIDIDSITPENFNSVDAIAAMIDKLL